MVSIMDVFSAICGRRSIRKFSSQEVGEETLNLVLEAARLSPSAANKQSWKFIVIREKETISKIAQAAGGQRFVEQAPVIIVSCGTDPEGVMMCGQNRYTVDVSIATAYLILEAYEQGLGTCWLGRFDEQKVKDLLGIPNEVRIVAVTVMGYPSESPTQTPRKNIEEIVSYERY